MKMKTWVIKKGNKYFYLDWRRNIRWTVCLDKALLSKNQLYIKNVCEHFKAKAVLVEMREIE